jgi:large subunit ribosomal protein L24
MSKNNLKIKKGDSVKVLSGKDKGKTGKVLRVYPADRKLVVENINVHTKFERAKRAGQPGQKVSFPSPMPVAKVMLVDSSGKTTRVGYQILENGEKQRIAKGSKKAIF